MRTYHYKWNSFGLEYPFQYGRDDNRWLKVKNVRTGEIAFVVPLFMGWRAEHLASKKCQELNHLGEDINLTEIDLTP